MHRLRVLVVPLLLAFLLLVSCADSGSPGLVETSDEQSRLDETPSTVGTSQGDLRTFSDGAGASVKIRPGAVDGDPAVTVSTLSTLDGLPLTGDPGAFAGGIVLEPHGLVLAEPVTITIPLTRPQTPGRDLRLFYWDGIGVGWEETDFFVTVDEDGLTASGDVSHFSYYVLQPSTLEGERDGVFGDIAGIASTVASGGGDLAAVTTAVFNEVIGHTNGRFPLYDKLVMDPPIPDGYNCYETVGLYFEFDHGGAEGIPQTLVETIGDIDDVEIRIDYLRAVDYTLKIGDVENELTGSMVVNVYWRSTPPNIELTASRDIIWGGETTSLTAELTCGDEGMADQDIEFVAAPGVAVGSFSPEGDQTSYEGIASSVFAADETAPGNVTVTAEHLWTNLTDDIKWLVTDSIDLYIGSVTGTWTVTGSETWTGCLEPTDNGTYSGSGNAHFIQIGETLSGSAEFPRNSDLFVGTVTRTGTGFTLSGTTNYREEYPICDDTGKCTDWIVKGIADFQGTGSIKARTIDFTWNGHDLVGDTCVFKGHGKATYQGP